MKKTLLAFMVLTCLMSCTTLPVMAQLSKAFTDRLDKVFDSTCNRLKIKGASAALLVPGGGTWKGVHGISSPGKPITSDMLFAISSNTKTFVSSTMLKLKEKGLISLDDTIGKWIINKPNISGKITIRQLLNHTSGLYNYTANPSFYDSINADLSRIWTKEEILNLVGAPLSAPGINWSYCNTNYILAGIIIEHVTGKSIQAVIRENVFTPCGLTQSFYHPFEAFSMTRADQWSLGVGANYLVDLETIPGFSTNALFSTAASAGGILETAEDNVTFWHKLTSGGIISATSWNDMRTYINIGGGDGYGLGIFYYSKAFNGRPCYSHGGTNLGYINDNLVDTTSGICISVLTNQDSIDNNKLLGVIIASLHKVTLQMQTTALEPAVGYQAAIRMYPNPVSHALTVSSETGTDGLWFNLYDISGKQQLSAPLSAGTTTFDVEALDAGYYFASVRDAHGMVISRQKICVSK